MTHGTKVADSYRWLEDDVRQNKDVAAWIEAKNNETFGFLDQIPGRVTIRKRLTELWGFERFNTLFKRGGRYDYFDNSGLQNQDTLFVQASLDGKALLLSIPAPGQKTAPLRSRARPSVMTPSTSHSGNPKPARTGTLGTSWRSPAARCSKYWKELVPQRAETLQGVGFVGRHFVASDLKDAQTQVTISRTQRPARRDQDLLYPSPASRRRRRSMVNSLREGAALPTDGVDGIKTMTVIDAIDAAAGLRRRSEHQQQFMSRTS